MDCGGLTSVPGVTVPDLILVLGLVQSASDQDGG